MELNTRLSSVGGLRCRRIWGPGLSALVALFVVFLASPAAVEAQGNHGIGTAKGCQSPVRVGDPLNCSIVVTNNQDTGNGTLGSADTLTVLSVVDWVCTDVAPPGCIGGAGNPNSGNIIQTVTKSFLGGSSCGVDPMDMVYKCTLPPGSAIAFGTIADPHSFYTVQPGDPDPLPDVASITWLDTCSSGANNCPQPPTAPLFATASSSVALTCPICGECEQCDEATNACVEDPQCTTDECLSKSPGFWSTHPAITSLFLPITVCGEPLDTTTAGSCSSVSEALCVAPGKELKANPPYAQLVRQLAAAKLNLAATAENAGFCGEDIAARIIECEALCGASKEVIGASDCIEDLDAFNNSVDTFLMTPAPFSTPGPASPGQCQAANGNGVVIGKNSCS